MGDCKTNMKPTTEIGKGLFGRITGRKKKDTVTGPDVAATFADILVSAEDRLGRLIMQKEGDLKHESGKESQNQKSLAVLQTMDFHLQSILDLAEEYSKQ